jgi:membrane-associated phospholipid phosphatase
VADATSPQQQFSVLECGVLYSERERTRRAIAFRLLMTCVKLLWRARFPEERASSMAATPTPAHDPRRVAFGVVIAFAVAFTLTVVLGFLLELGWASDGSTRFDSQITQWFVDHRTPTWTDAMRIVTWLGSSAVVIPSTIVVVVALLIGRRRWLALFLALAVSGASLLSVLAKHVIGRDRPPADLRLQQAHSSAFPSGHATQAAATYLALAIVVTVLSRSRPLRAATWVAAALIVGLVGVSRVYLGMHWATDVLGGWLLGSVWVAGLSVALAPLDPGRHATSRASTGG